MSMNQIQGFYLRHLTHTDGTVSTKVALVPCDGTRVHLRVYDSEDAAMKAMNPARAGEKA